MKIPLHNLLATLGLNELDINNPAELAKIKDHLKKIEAELIKEEAEEESQLKDAKNLII